MKNKKATATLISILTVILMMFAVTTTVFATDELGTLTPPAEDSEPTMVVIEDTTTATEHHDENQTNDDDYSDVSDDDDYNYDTPTEAEVVTEAPTYYEMYGDELPEVESQDITEPTIMEIPEVEVSDTSLLGGVIAWLCVAVGIAVIAGVLVSQRTRQTNVQSSGRSDRRR